MDLVRGVCCLTTQRPQKFYVVLNLGPTPSLYYSSLVSPCSANTLGGPPIRLYVNISLQCK